MTKPEILAPAGSVKALHAAVNAGADAVYLGGTRYGARAYAGNFEENELIEGIRYAHLHGVKVYLTVNTLFRNEEIEELYDYLFPYYKEGLDAVIVQDFGAMLYIHEHFPSMSIHASTQMTITTPYAYRLLKEYGVDRVVPARELSIDELIDIKTNYGNISDPSSIPELEVFVHGALCICYSGQCFMSSFIGGRSGNRGRCAGSCRLPYTVLDKNGAKTGIEGAYPLSTKDLCGLGSLPELIDIGVDSLKIEGRMKTPEYVACCVRNYRRCVDFIVKDYDNFHNKTTEYNTLISRCRDEMAEVFNRSGFTAGYYHRNNGKDMMSMDIPGHSGVIVGKIRSLNNNKVTVFTEKRVNKSDILIIYNNDGHEITLTSNVESAENTEIVLNAPKSKTLRKGMKVYRRYNSFLISEVHDICDNDIKIPINGNVSIEVGKPMSLTLSAVVGGRRFNICCYGDEAGEAQSRPVTEDIIRSKICQTGDSPFCFHKFDAAIDDNAFVPIKTVKELRRNAFNLLSENIYKSYYRDDMIRDIPRDSTAIYTNNDHDKRIRVTVSDSSQLEMLQNYGNKVMPAIDLQYFEKRDIISIIREHPDYTFVLPMILRKDAITDIKELIHSQCQCIIVRNIDELSLLKVMGYKGGIVCDYSLYSMNDEAVRFIRKQFPEAVITLPVELNGKQLKSLGYYNYRSECIVYGHQPLMVTAQCFRENISGCSKGGKHGYVLIDRMNRRFFVKTVCRYCYNIVFNGVPTVFFDQNDFINGYNGTMRFQFTVETRESVKQVLDTFFAQNEYKGDFTRGHLKRGVE